MTNSSNSYEDELGCFGEAENKDSVTMTRDSKRKYDEEKRREALLKAKENLENNEKLDDIPSDYSSSTEDEDSDAELLDFKIQSKILDTLTLIKEKNPAIYDKSHIIFPESEDESSGSSEKESSKAKPMTYKDYERRMLLEIEKRDGKIEEIDFKGGKSNKIGYDKEQEELKRAFIEASNGLEDEDDDDSGMFVRKEKSQEEVEKEENSFKMFLSQNRLNNLNGDSMESLNRYWGPEEELNENERFLRNYILNQEWKENKGHPKINDDGSSKDIQIELDEINEEEDEKHLELSNEFESIYNFRYEEPNLGQQIQGYSRNMTSLRRQDDRRKLERKRKKERKAEEILKLKERVKVLKSSKKKEIIEKLREIQKISGNVRITSEEIDLEGEFDSEKHDKCMEQIFGSEYNNDSESLTLKEILSESKDECANSGRSQTLKSNENIGYINQVEDDQYDDEEWWQCDGCLKEILPNKKKFDCTVCENYTLCKSCCRSNEHDHPLTKSRVPNRPEGKKESIKNNSDVFNFKYGENEEVNKLLDEYYGLDFEDVLDGGKLPVRFKYTKVEKEDYGLKLEDILSMNDKELNQHVSLKKLAPYRTDKKVKYTKSKNPNTYQKSHKTLNKKSNKNHYDDNNKQKSQIKDPQNQVNKHRLKAYY